MWWFVDVFVLWEFFGEQVMSVFVVEGDLVVNNGYWDIYCMEWLVFVLFDFVFVGWLFDGQFVQFCWGGWMVWWSVLGYVDSMVGMLSDQIFVDVVWWGLFLIGWLFLRVVGVMCVSWDWMFGEVVRVLFVVVLWDIFFWRCWRV